MPTDIVDDPLAGCTDPEHNPPMHITIPAGKMMRHTCPSCGKVTVLRNNIRHERPISPFSPFSIDPWSYNREYPTVYRTNPNRPPWEIPIVRFQAWL